MILLYMVINAYVFVCVPENDENIPEISRNYLTGELGREGNSFFLFVCLFAIDVLIKKLEIGRMSNSGKRRHKSIEMRKCIVCREPNM